MCGGSPSFPLRRDPGGFQERQGLIGFQQLLELHDGVQNQITVALDLFETTRGSYVTCTFRVFSSKKTYHKKASACCSTKHGFDRFKLQVFKVNISVDSALVVKSNPRGVRAARAVRAGRGARSAARAARRVATATGGAWDHREWLGWGLEKDLVAVCVGSHCGSGAALERAMAMKFQSSFLEPESRQMKSQGNERPKSFPVWRFLSRAAFSIARFLGKTSQQHMPPACRKPFPPQFLHPCMGNVLASAFLEQLLLVAGSAKPFHATKKNPSIYVGLCWRRLLADFACQVSRISVLLLRCWLQVCFLSLVSEGFHVKQTNPKGKRATGHPFPKRRYMNIPKTFTKLLNQNQKTKLLTLQNTLLLSYYSRLS